MACSWRGYNYLHEPIMTQFSDAYIRDQSRNVHNTGVVVITQTLNWDVYLLLAVNTSAPIIYIVAIGMIFL